MKSRLITACTFLALILTGAVGGVTLLGTAGAATAAHRPHPQSTTPPTVICANNPCQVNMPNNGQTGLKIMDSVGPLLDNPFIIEDHNGAPMFWVNVGGADSGDTPFCVSSPNILYNEACIRNNDVQNADGTWTYTGSLQLQVVTCTSQFSGCTVTSSETLWPGDIRWIHNQRGIG